MHVYKYTLKYLHNDNETNPGLSGFSRKLEVKVIMLDSKSQGPSVAATFLNNHVLVVPQGQVIVLVVQH